QIDGIVVDEGSPQTNMIYLNLSPDISISMPQVAEEMKKIGVLIDAEHPRRLRLVTHYGVDDDGVEQAVSGFKTALTSLG
ncbi:MAG: hypothetical protein R3307_01845, partial [Anaerolineales bacterium]|nr:hypothetical protein [Anaerolineales bacterium]